MSFLQSHLADILIIAALAIISFFAIRHVIRLRKSGGCSACASSGTCSACHAGSASDAGIRKTGSCPHCH
ncbi:MAG: FeoB-associated Cys-rich membrane protein [Peptoniphilaceae bacterium]|nr:FeoB-associated Cys-rich membrane protein [Peptoniphilaceae bacterium]